MTDTDVEPQAAPPDDDTTLSVVVFAFKMPNGASYQEGQARFGRIMDEVAYHLTTDKELPTATTAYLGIKDVAEQVINVFAADGTSMHTSDGSRPKGHPRNPR